MTACRQVAAICLREGVSDSHPLELPKIAIVAPQRADAVLPHERHEMGVRDEIPPYNGAGRYRAVHLPEVITFTDCAGVRKPQELADVPGGDLNGKRPGKDRRVRG